MSLSIPRIYAGRYEIVRPLGDGAFSRTFVARDTVLQRDVALKVLRREHHSNSEFTARFDREAQTAAQVSHTNVVPIFDFGREQQIPFIVMQYIDGRTLREFDREEGPLTTEEVISIGRQVLDGLAAIHDESIVHRDVKPQNVLLDKRMVARLSDFGVAFLANDITLTETGTTIGTAAYMAPEQATGQTVGPAADIYSVGVMLYELLTGRLPFRGDNPVQVLYRHVSDQPPRPRDLNPRIPIALEAVILRALAKIPSERFPDARTMRDHLGGKPVTAPLIAPSEAVRAEPQRFTTATTPSLPAAPTRRTPAPARSGPKRKRRSWLVPVILAIALLAIATVVFAMSRLDGGGGNDPAAAIPTQTAIVVPGGIPASPTASEEPVRQPTDTSAPTQSEATVASTGTQPPSSTESPAVVPTTPLSGSAPTAAFNAPFLLSALPPTWAQGGSITFGRDDFVAGGAYRRDDGVLYGRPAAHFYSQETEYARVTVQFTLPEAPAEHIGIVLRGMDDELPGTVPCRIQLNGNVVWQGASPFANEEWTLVGWQIGSLTWLQAGVNTLTFEVLSETGDFGLPPWILLTEAAVYWD